MEAAKHYLAIYQKAKTREERKALLIDYQAFLKTLSLEDREQARQYMQHQLRPQLYETATELDILTNKAEQILGERVAS